MKINKSSDIKVNFDPDSNIEKSQTLDTSNLESMTDWVRFGTTALANNDVTYVDIADGAHEEAVGLLLYTVGLNQIPEQWTDAKLTDTERTAMKVLLERRCFDKIPTSYLTNRAVYADMPFYIDQRVQIPRSPVQQLIRENFSNVLKNKPKRVLDLTAGSGAIGISMAVRMDSIEEVIIADIDSAALEVAQHNINIYGLQDKVKIVQSDLFENIEGTFDLIIATPPHMSEDEYAGVGSAEFYKEPKISFCDGADGMTVINQVIRNAKDYLTDTGVLLCEVQNKKEDVIREYGSQCKFKWLDLTGHVGYEYNVFGTNKAELNNVK